MLAKVKEQVRYRRALRGLAAPPSPRTAYFSRFGGLWTDRRDAEAEIDRRVAAGALDELGVARLRHWVAHGYVVLERAVSPDVCDRLRSELEGAFDQGDERLLMTSPGGAYEPLRADRTTDQTRVVDVYAFYHSALEALFCDAIVRFLRSAFDDVPLLFQSLTFEKGSQQMLHQDPGFVVVTSPLEFAAAWIALEDIRPGSGELMYLDGSHRLPEYLFSGKYKHWNAKRDGDEQQAEWHRLMYENAERMGMEQRTFLAKKGDALIWSADLAHGGSPVEDPELTRKSIVGHYCPERVEPFYFQLHPKRRATQTFRGNLYASQHYTLDE